MGMCYRDNHSSHLFDDYNSDRNGEDDGCVDCDPRAVDLHHRHHDHKDLFDDYHQV